MTNVFNKEKTIELLKRLVETPSPSGYTSNVMALIAKEFECNWCYLIKQRIKVQSLRQLKEQIRSRHRLLTAHTDTLGAMVKEVKRNGRLKLAMIGGFNWNAVEGEYCIIHTASGKKVRGTILMHQTTVHVYRNAGTAERNADNIEVRIDEKC